MRRALRILLDEHLTLSALLRSLPVFLEEARTTGTKPDFSVLRAILFYIAEFPEKRHHRKESDFLFPKLRARTPLSRALLDHLDEDHTRGEAKIRQLEHALTAYEMLGSSQHESFEKATKRYVDFYLAHMALEEREILPLATRVLTSEDWDELDLAMALDLDPLTGVESEQDFRTLFSRVVFQAPAKCNLVGESLVQAVFR